MIVMETDGSLFYSSSVDPSAELLNILRSHLREVPLSGTVKLYYTERDHLYSITAQQLQMNSVRRYLFYCVPSRIPLHTSRTGIRMLNRGECEYLFMNSFTV